MNEDAKKTLLRAVPHGLYIITTGTGDSAHGFTSTWFTQASFKPPLVVTAVRRDSHAYTTIRDNNSFIVNYIPKSARAAAEVFFKPPRPENNKFGIYTFAPSPVSGGPVLEVALGYLDCKLVHIYDNGDHSLFVGEVTEAEVRAAGEPLVLGDTPWKYGG
ncbi:MAG: flavin reductase family protein [Planctomycetota bacterium]